MLYALSRLPNNGNQKTAHEYNYIMENMSEIYNIEELFEVIFRINFRIMDQYQQKYPILIAKLVISKYKCGPFCGGNNNNFNHITCKNTIGFPSIIQR